MKVIIEKFEGNYATVLKENNKPVNLPIECVPSGAEIGTVISIEIDHEESDRRKNNITNIIDGIAEVLSNI